MDLLVGWKRIPIPGGLVRVHDRRYDTGPGRKGRSRACMRGGQQVDGVRMCFPRRKAQEDVVVDGCVHV
jgi:hypothetical protein